MSHLEEQLCFLRMIKLKLIKNHLRLFIGQEWLSYLPIISMDYNIVQNTNYEDKINQFAEMKARKVQLKFTLLKVY